MLELARELIATYRKHGWLLRRVLTRRELHLLKFEIDESVSFCESTIDALWFSRPSNQDREAWELRLVAENPYALFETFEADETEEMREEARMEMEARMREKLQPTDAIN